MAQPGNMPLLERPLALQPSGAVYVLIVSGPHSGGQQSVKHSRLNFRLNKHEYVKYLFQNPNFFFNNNQKHLHLIDTEPFRDL